MRVLGQSIAFTDNVLFSWRRYRLWWWVLLVTATFDYATTLMFVEVYGVKTEANPVVAALIRWLGLPLGALLAKVLQLGAVVAFAGLHRRLGNLFLLVVIVLNCWAVVINSWSLWPASAYR